MILLLESSSKVSPEYIWYSICLFVVNYSNFNFEGTHISGWLVPSVSASVLADIWKSLCLLDAMFGDVNVVHVLCHLQPRAAARGRVQVQADKWKKFIFVGSYASM
ncbi:hypothetical protein QQ045_019350 [Rhodiola kirilowii]